MLDSSEIKDPTSFSWSFSTQNKTNKHVRLNTPVATKEMLPQTGQQKTMFTTSGSQPGLDWQTPANGNCGLKLGKGLTQQAPVAGDCALQLGQGFQTTGKLWTEPKARGSGSRQNRLPVQADRPGRPVQVDARILCSSRSHQKFALYPAIVSKSVKKQKFKRVNFKVIIGFIEQLMNWVASYLASGEQLQRKEKFF